MADETLQNLIEALRDEQHLGILLAAQMGGTPEEVQLIVQVADYDVETEAIRPTQVYILRCLGVREHRLSLGLFNSLVLVDDHPLLWKHSFRHQQIYFRGTPHNVDELMLELNQLYGQKYGAFRSLADDVNHAMPFGTLLSSGHGLLGEMPMPMAALVKPLLEKHDLTVTLVNADHKPSATSFKLLVLDDSYFIVQMVSADPMQSNN